MSAQAWRARPAYWARRLGVPGGLGALALLATLVFLFLNVLPAADRAAGLGARKTALLQRAAQQASGADGVPRTPSQQLLAFYDDFPPSAEIADVLSGLHEIATEQRLALDLGDYSVIKTQGARLDQLRITFPVKGGYVQVRKFVAEALLAQPSLALESLSLRRDKVAEEGLDGRIVFLLFLEHGV